MIFRQPITITRTDPKQSVDCAYQGLTCANISCNNAGEMTPPLCDSTSIGQVDCSGTELRVCDGALWVAFHCETSSPGRPASATTMLGARCKFYDDTDVLGDLVNVNICSDKSHLVVCLAGKKTTVECPGSCSGTSCAP